MQTIKEKSEIVSNLNEKLEHCSGIYLADFKGMDVETTTQLREQFREKNIHMQVVKNTLLKKAFKDLEITGLDEYLLGPTSIILATEDEPSAPAKIIIEFHKKNENLLNIKSVQLDSQSYDGSKLADLAKMPNKEELQSMIVSMVMSPGANLVALLKGPGSKLASQIKSLIEKLEKPGA